MKPGRTLYDALGLDATATRDALLARADALRAQLLADTSLPSDERDNRLKIISYAREVFADATQRDRYDQSLRRSAAPPAFADTQSTAAASTGFAGSAWRTWFAAALAIIAMLVAYLVVMQRRVSVAPPPAHGAVIPAATSDATKAPSATAVADTHSVTSVRDARPGAPSSSASGEERTPAEVFRANERSIVVVRGQRDARAASQGSGVVIAPEAVITNCHVALGASDLSVVMQGRSYPATIRYRDQGHDLCLLSVPTLTAPAVVRGRVADVGVGARVYAIGAPQGLDLSLSEGIVASLRRFDDSNLIQTTAAISPGSSGGGLFDGRGRLVGITTFQSRSGQNLNFAVPADWIDALPARNGNAESLLPDSSGASGLPEALKPRPATPATLGAQAETRQRLLLGTWECHAGARSAALAQYEFGEDGSAVLRLRPAGGEWQTLRGRYWANGADTLALGPSQNAAPPVQLRMVEVTRAQAVFEWLSGERAMHYCSRPAR